MPDDMQRLLGLMLVSLVALGAVVAVMRLSRRETPAEPVGLVLGYPPDHYPLRHVAQHPALQTLAAVQTRLATMRRQIPPGHPSPALGEVAIWLQVLLIELRDIMNVAYQVVAITGGHRRSPHLEAIVAEVQQIEEQVVETVTARLLARGEASVDDSLTLRLQNLRRSAAELRGLADGRPAEAG
jgi:hypothetical protein